jgi:hypothetical protein
MVKKAPQKAAKVVEPSVPAEVPIVTAIVVEPSVPAEVPIVTAIAPEPPVEANNTVTNKIEGTRLHLGDGRVLEFGESAEVGEDLASQLRASGQAE